MAFITLCRYGEHMSIKIRTQNKHCLQYHWLFSKAMCKKTRNICLYDMSSSMMTNFVASH